MTVRIMTMAARPLLRLIPETWRPLTSMALSIHSSNSSSLNSASGSGVKSFLNSLMNIIRVTA